MLLLLVGELASSGAGDMLLLAISGLAVFVVTVAAAGCIGVEGVVAVNAVLGVAPS
jgi:hypothetical protein